MVVGEPVQWQPEEDLASIQSTSDLVDPVVVEVGHPSRSIASKRTRLDAVPEVWALEVAVSLHWVWRPAALAGEGEEFCGVAQDRACWRRGDVKLLAGNQDERCSEEHESGQRVTQPESNVLLCVDHSNTANQRSSVDHHVEVEKNSAVGHLRVDDDALAGLQRGDLWASLLDLLGEQWRDVGFETTSSDSHDDQTDSEASDGGIWVVHDAWNGGNNEDGVSDQRSEDTVLDCGVSTEVGIGDVPTEKWHEIRPELVESRQTSGSLLTPAKTTGLLACGFIPSGSIVAFWRGVDRSSARSERTWLLEEVDEDCRGAVIRETLTEFDLNLLRQFYIPCVRQNATYKGDSPSSPWNLA